MPPKRRDPLDVFPLEVWIATLRHLCKPVPAPLSCPDRAEMKHPALAAAARSCKLFHSICTPILYTNIVTDDLQVVFAEIKTPSFHKSLAFIERIYVEYSEELSMLTYLPIFMAGGKQGWVGMEKPMSESNIMRFCMVEVDSLARVSFWLKKLGARELLPKLHSIAVSSIYGRSNSLWQRYDRWQKATGKGIPLDSVKVNWDRFIAASNVKHVCVRDTAGPLGQVPIRAELKRPDVVENEPSMTLHFSEDIDDLSLRAGMPIRWVSDIPTSRPWHETYYKIATQFVRFGMRRNRTEELIEDPYYRCLLDVYFSTDHLGPTPVVSGSAVRLDQIAEKAKIPLIPGGHLSTEKQRAIAKAVGSHLEEWIIDDGCDDFVDEIKWHASADAPVCEACGSGPPA